MQRIRTTYSPSVIASWLQEFGYQANEAGLDEASAERGNRLFYELGRHGKRLADRAQMGPQRMTGRTGVIPR